MEERINYRGYTIKIEYDTDSPNPLTDWDMFGTFVCFHSRYDLSSPGHGFKDPEDFREYIKENSPLCLSLYLYDHSGITISARPFYGRAVHAEWDSSQVGWIYVDKDKIRKEYGCKRVSQKTYDKAVKLLKSEVETFDEYLTGEVYCYVIEETGESCGGYFGDYGLKSAIKDAKDVIDCTISQISRKHFRKLMAWIANKVPLTYRKPCPVSS